MATDRTEAGKFMIVEGLKAFTRSVPPLFNVVFPALGFLRRTTGRETELDRFRQYCFRLPRMVPNPVFVKVGANDGVTGDPCSDILLANRRWHGLLIEPVPFCFDRLRATFRDTRRFTLEPVAIGIAAADVPFYYVSAEAKEHLPGLPVWFDQLGSFDRSHILKHLDGALEPFIVECRLQVLPLEEVLTRSRIRTVHLLHVDTEGHDLEVLKTLDLSTNRPLTVLIEHMHLSAAGRAEMHDLLERHGYEVRDCGGDFFAVHQESDARLRG